MTTPETPTSITEIVSLLERASDAYYNGRPVLLDDDSFDFLVDRLRELEPAHPFLDSIGAPPTENATELPYPMPSLDKIKPGQGVLARFIAKNPSVVLSEKLDGLSALWCPATRSLYLRGDGRIGQPISSLAAHIQGLVPSAESWAIRVEIILPRAPGARALLNGLVHQTAPTKEALSRIRFIGYEVISPPGLARAAQFEWLRAQGFETPWWQATTALTEEICATAFSERRVNSAYETDGIVVGANQVPANPVNKNPKDCVAFKMPVDDQSALTTVREVIWTASAQGYLIPRVRFDPVQIGGASIEFCTGHNGRTVVDRGLGPGAKVKIRRSGDVIPTLDSVLFPAEPSLPADASSWIWAGDATTATHICSKKLTAEQTVSQVLHFAKTHSIPGLGPANCKLLVKANICGPAALWRAPAATLAALLGPKTGETIYAELRTLLSASSTTLSEQALMVSSSVIPRGVGETKLKALFLTCPDPRKWREPTLEAPPGWTDGAFREFQAEYVKYEEWRAKEIFWIPYPIPVVASPAPHPKRAVCFTGFRDKELEVAAQAQNFEIVASVTANLNVLVVPDGEYSESEKVKKAKKNGTIDIVARSEFVKKYLAND